MGDLWVVNQELLARKEAKKRSRGTDAVSDKYVLLYMSLGLIWTKCSLVLVSAPQPTLDGALSRILCNLSRAGG